MKKALWLSLLISQLLVIAGFWAWTHTHHAMGNQLTGGVAGKLLAYGRLAGLLAAFGVLLQLTLIGRVRWVERIFGLDRLSRLHHIAGFLLLIVLLAHPFLVNTGHALQAGVGRWAQFLDFCRTWDDVLPAAIGLAIIVVALLLSAVFVAGRIGYETWHATHLLLYIAVILAFGHQLAVGSDFTGNEWFTAYWRGLYIVVVGSFVFYRFIRPLWLFFRHRFIVAGLTLESGDVTSVRIEGRNLEAFHAEAGQFVIVRFLAPGFRWEAHPFSISMRPDGKQIRLTIKGLGDYTRRIPDLKPGTRVIIDGPHGIFTVRRCVSDRVLMIAGGIGITPVRSVAEELVAGGRDVVLLYGNRNGTSVVFERELRDLVAASSGRLKVVCVMSDDAGWPGEKGRIDQDRILRLVPDVRERDVYLCGPPVMMRLIRASLLKLRVPKRRVYYERFAL